MGIKVEEDAIPLEDELEVGGIKYCAPTVPREEFERTGVGGGGQKKYNYCENFDRPTYSKKVELPKLNQRGNIMRNKETNDVMYEMQETDESVPNMEFLRKHALNEDSPPHLWLNAYLPYKKSRSEMNAEGTFTIGEWATFTHLKAQLCNAGKGGSMYRDYTQLTLEDVMKHIGVYFIHGVSPSPQVEHLCHINLKTSSMEMIWLQMP